MDLPRLVSARLDELLPEARLFVVGVSGGADSVALLRALAADRRPVVVAHLDHGLRPESVADAEFVSRLASELGVPARIERVEAAGIAAARGWNLEDAARRVRYEFLARTARDAGAGGVLTAHTLDDQAETVIMQLLRGAAYLRGIEPVRGNVARPLLDVGRSELVDYLHAAGQTWREDRTNLDTSRTRAWVRHEVLPLLRSRYPSLARTLGRHARLQADLAGFLRDEAGRLRRGGGFDARSLAARHPAVQREAVRLLFEDAGVAPTADRIEDVRSRLGSRDPYRLSLSPRKSLRLAYGRLELVRREPPPTETRPATSPVLSTEQLPEGVSERALELPDLVLRSRAPGDRMRLAPGSRTLARILIDRKIPREERDSLRVLASGSDIVWVERIGVAEGYASAGPPDPDEPFMARALELAREAAAAGELPVGAVVVSRGRIVAEARNETRGATDPTAHAEILAMRRAASALGDWRLGACTLYVTLEPCPMCTGAALAAHVSRIVYGAANRRDGALGSVDDMLAAPWKRDIEVRGGVLGGRAGRLLSEFFARVRASAGNDGGEAERDDARG